MYTCTREDLVKSLLNKNKRLGENLLYTHIKHICIKLSTRQDFNLLTYLILSHSIYSAHTVVI